MGLTALCIVASLVLCSFVIQHTRAIRAGQVVQMQWAEVQSVLGYRKMMYDELMAYSKRDPEILRILQPPATPAAAPAKSPAKPQAK